MGQVDVGLRSILERPMIYSLLQTVLGAHKFRKDYVNNYIKVQGEMSILDIGCGTAEILGYLPNVKYVGFDTSANYIAKAQRTFGDRGEFHCRAFTKKDLKLFPPFDLVLLLGVLHHLDDDYAMNLISLCSVVVKEGGRCLSFDPCLDANQNIIAKTLVKNDRGQNVRDKKGYHSLFIPHFREVHVEVKHQRWFPYSRCFIECIK